MAWTNPFTTADRIMAELAEHRRIIVSNQAKLNAIATTLGVISESVTKGTADVTGAIERLKAAAPEDLDFTAVDRVVAQLGIAARALDDLVPEDIEAEDPTSLESDEPVESTPGETPAPETPVEAETPATEAAPEATTDAAPELEAATEDAAQPTPTGRSRRAKPANAETPEA